jgi:hypothetical protein
LNLQQAIGKAGLDRHRTADQALRATYTSTRGLAEYLRGCAVIKQPTDHGFRIVS